jgi:hypothetical protein
MSTINQIKQLAEADTPLLFFQCVLPSGDAQYWSTYTLPFGGNTYTARVLKHDLFDLQLCADDAMDGLTKLSLTLANADSELSQLNAAIGFKGSQLTAYFAFADLPSLTVTSESTVLFQGIAGDPDQIGEDFLTLSFTNKLSLQRIPVPDTRIQRSCPWTFPSTPAQRQEALSGGDSGRFSRFYRCGYSADIAGGSGNLSGGLAFTACDYSRTQCVQRGMFSADSNGNATARFGGLEFVPPAIQVRTYGDKTSQLSALIDNTAKYNDAVPIVYGTGWIKSPVVFARNDGNLTHMETLLGLGPISSVLKVVVNDIEIPLPTQGQDVTATGWYSIVSTGTRQGAFNLDWVDSSGNPLGDPHGSIASLSIVVPNRISTGQSTPTVEVLMQGMQVDTFASDGSLESTVFSNNPAWVILDILRRCGWALQDLNLPAFATSAAFCDTLITVTDLNGNQLLAPRYSCNLVLTKRQSAAVIVRGIRVAASLMIRYGVSGLLELLPETTLAMQQSVLPDGSNSVEMLNGGWPAYEFSDVVGQSSGIARDPKGKSTMLLSSNSVAETSNCLNVEFQDEFNEYQQDSLSTVNSEDVALIGYEISSQSTAMGITNYSQATRVLLRQLDKGTDGNLYINFVTSFRALKVRPGDIIAVTYQKEGFLRTPFRVVRLSPAMNYQFVTIQAQIHDDDWYSDSITTLLAAGRQPASQVQVPRPLIGLVPILDADGQIDAFDFEITDAPEAQTDGTTTDTLTVSFSVPSAPSLKTLSIPVLSLSPTYNQTGGTLEGGATYYYAISAVDAAENEGDISFTASITLPDGPNTYTVTISQLSFPANSSTFHAYRGLNPQILYRIASNVPLASSFQDTGLPLTPIGPPDASFDHANFYYRYEYGGPYAVTAFSATTIACADMGATVGAYSDFSVRIISGTGQGQEVSITSNDQTMLTISPPWSTIPDLTSFFVVVEPSWIFAAVSNTSPLQFEIPYSRGEVIEISGRSANVNNQEASAALCPITRWALGDGNPDVGLAGIPNFVISAIGAGNLALTQVGFGDTLNTFSVTSGTLQLFHWNELNTPSPYALAAEADAGSTMIVLNQIASPSPYLGQAFQIGSGSGSEVVTFVSVNAADNTYSVNRGQFGSTASAHSAGDAVLPLDNSTIIVPFAPGFFQNAASSNYIHTVAIPDVRIIAAEFSVNNAFGSSLALQQSYAVVAPQSSLLRTLSGGQFSLQVNGYLATQQNAAPPLVVQATHAIRDMRATLSQAASGYDIVVTVLQNGVLYGSTLTIPSGESSSSIVEGVNFAPLLEDALLTLDIALNSVTSTATTGISPGRDLTVTIRF